MTEEKIYDEIVARSDVGNKFENFWKDVIEDMPYEFFKIEKQGNRIVICPVEIREIIT